MCCRFVLAPALKEEEKILTLMDRYYPGQYQTGEIRPGDTAPAFAASREGVGPVPATFGLLGLDGGKLLINARSETVAEKPLFAESFARRRLVLPATGFFEWKKTEGKRQKEKYEITVKGAPLFYLCAIYQVQEGKCRFAILTRAANEEMSAIHDRMPLIALPGQVKGYLRQEAFARQLIETPGPSLVLTARTAGGAQDYSYTWEFL